MSPHNAPSVLIVGSGAMACLFAARLSAAGVQVTLLGTWREGLQALRHYGVRLTADDGRRHAYPVRVAQTPKDCTGIPFALVLVKSWQTGRAAQQLAECLPPDGLALTLQNGLGNYEQLALALGAQRVALGVTTVGATLLGPGQVRQAGQGIVSLSAHPRMAPLAGAFRAAGFKVENVADPDSLLWGKLVINAAINPLTALLRVPNGELLEHSTARALMHAAANEAASVAAALGIHLPYPDPPAAAEAVARRTANNRSSMLQDVLRGAPTEIDAICGAIVQAGEGLGVPTPVNLTLWQLVKALSADDQTQPLQAWAPGGQYVFPRQGSNSPGSR